MGAGFPGPAVFIKDGGLIPVESRFIPGRWYGEEAFAELRGAILASGLLGART